KSDLKKFGVYTETTDSGKFLELYWSRVQNPSGTTNMDFELNQNFCNPSGTPTNCANNSITPPETPVRKAGDKLITYDLAKGGTVPIISIRTWSGSAWGAAQVLSGGTLGVCDTTPAHLPNCAVGSVNSSSIAGVDSEIGSQDAFTFGEAAISFAVLFQQGGG